MPGLSGSPEPTLMNERTVVLVVDDVTATRTRLAHLLELRGYETRSAGDGQRAIQILREDGDVRLVILDLAMPLHDGYWFRQEQLRDRSIAHVPVIVFTGMAHETVVKSLEGVAVLSKRWRSIGCLRSSPSIAARSTRPPEVLGGVGLFP